MRSNFRSKLLDQWSCDKGSVAETNALIWVLWGCLLLMAVMALIFNIITLRHPSPDADPTMSNCPIAKQSSTECSAKHATNQRYKQKDPLLDDRPVLYPFIYPGTDSTNWIVTYWVGW